MDRPAHSQRTQEQLIDDLRLVIDNAEELLNNTGSYTGTHYQNARAKLVHALHAATLELAKFEDARLARMIEATRAANALHAADNAEQKLLRAFD